MTCAISFRLAAIHSCSDRWRDSLDVNVRDLACGDLACDAIAKLRRHRMPAQIVAAIATNLVALMVMVLRAVPWLEYIPDSVADNGKL